MICTFWLTDDMEFTTVGASTKNELMEILKTDYPGEYENVRANQGPFLEAESEEAAAKKALQLINEQFGGYMRIKLS